MGKSITDLSSVTTVGLDLAKHVFQVHEVDASGRVVVAKRSGEASCYSFSRRCRLALSGSRPRDRRITGRESSSSLAMTRGR
jgi:transposase